MPVLRNQRHERFAQELARGRAACRAYDAAGYKPDRGAAARLSANVSVHARVRELQGEAAEIAVLDRAFVLKRLMRNADQAEEMSAANRALELLGKELGMFVDRSEVQQRLQVISDEPMTEEEWEAKHCTPN
jgi:phage terminase small subunit